MKQTLADNNNQLHKSLLVNEVNIEPIIYKDSKKRLNSIKTLFFLFISIIQGIEYENRNFKYIFNWVYYLYHLFLAIFNHSFISFIFYYQISF